jgi:hypothetical protein
MTQIDSIRAHLVKGKPITPLEALERYGCFRLAAVIFKIREEGFTVETEMVHKGQKKWASYTLTGYGNR